MDEVTERMRLLRYSIHIERSYCVWIKRYIVVHKTSSRAELLNGEVKIEQLLTDSVIHKNMAPATQNQAFNALLLLYDEVLKTPLTGKINVIRATKKINIPAVLTRDKIRQIINVMEGNLRL